MQSSYFGRKHEIYRRNLFLLGSEEPVEPTFLILSNSVDKMPVCVEAQGQSRFVLGQLDISPCSP